MAKKIRLFFKLFYNFEAKTKIKEVIRKEKIDLVHTIQIVNFLSPSIIDACKEIGVPIIFTVSDYQLLCPNYTFFSQGQICEKCRDGYFYSVRNRCLKNSYLISLSKAISMHIHNFFKVNEKINLFLTFSNFTRNKMIEFGFNSSRIYMVPNLVNADNFIPSYEDKKYILYVGNISEGKGVRILIKAFKGIDRNIKLKIAGEVRGIERENLKAVTANDSNIEILGFKDGRDLVELYKDAAFVIFPSLWYEAGPHVILEAMASGKPVIGTRVGSIPELIDNGRDGLLCEPGDSTDLKNKIEYLIDNPQLVVEMGRRARIKVEKCFNPELHYRSLISIYESCLNKSK